MSLLRSLSSLHLCKAIAAVNRTIISGLERHSCLAAAGSAGSSEELTGSAGSVLASVTASLAALGLVLEAALCVKFLFAGGENKLSTALFANQSLVFVHFESSLLASVLPRRAFLIFASASAEIAGVKVSRQFLPDALHGIINGFLGFSAYIRYFRI